MNELLELILFGWNGWVEYIHSHDFFIITIIIIIKKKKETCGAKLNFINGKRNVNFIFVFKYIAIIKCSLFSQKANKINEDEIIFSNRQTINDNDFMIFFVAIFNHTRNKLRVNT